VLWAKQFLGIEGKIFKFFGGLNPFWLLDFPLILALLFFIYAAIKRTRSLSLLMPLAVIGLTTLITEILVILSFQVYYGYLYKKIALLFAAFMLGLAVGSAVSARKPKKMQHIPVIQIVFVLMLILLYNLFTSKPPEFFFFCFLFVMGILSGYLFIVLNHLYLKNKKNFGVGYGIDLLGSFMGALFASSLLIPLVGQQTLLRYLILLNSFSVVFSLWSVIRSKYLH
jgi:spermidine synthase